MAGLSGGDKAPNFWEDVMRGWFVFSCYFV